MLEVPGGIQDFPEGERTNPKCRVGAPLYYSVKISKNCMKLRKIGPGGPHPKC